MFFVFSINWTMILMLLSLFIIIPLTFGRLLSFYGIKTFFNISDATISNENRMDLFIPDYISFLLGLLFLQSMKKIISWVIKRNLSLEMKLQKIYYKESSKRGILKVKQIFACILFFVFKNTKQSLVHVKKIY